MKILITGASSYVGARLYFDLQKKYDVVGTYFSSRLSKKFLQLDTTDKSAVIKLIKKLSPKVIIHAAGNASATWCEENKRQAIKINFESTIYVVDAANQVKAKLFFMSSYAAQDTSNVYGQTKANSEIHIKKFSNNHVILRPSLIIGFSPNTKNDRPFNRLLKNLDDNIPAIYDTSWKFYPTYIKHISEVIDEVIKKDIQNETIPIAVDKVITRYQLAKDILNPLGIKVKKEDKKSTLPLTKENRNTLKDFGLQHNTYKKMIKAIVQEIKHRHQFRLK